MRDTFLPYFYPALENDEINAVVEALTNGWLTTGPLTKAFEEAFAATAGVKHAIALNSCTAGLHLGLTAMGVGNGDEVVMPSLSFVAGAQCTRLLGATPIFCDVDPTNLCATVDRIRAVTTKRTKVIIPMQYAGHPVDIEAIVNFASECGIMVLEDAAHAAGTLRSGRWAGCVSNGAAYSFYATKNITSAEGGMFVTNDDDLAERLRVLALHGMDRDAWKRYTHGGNWQYDVIATGHKYNMPDVAAALGLAQLRKLENMQKRRELIAQRYIEALRALPGLTPLSLSLGEADRHSWCMFVIQVDESKAGISRDDLIEELRAAKIGTSVHYIPTHLFTAYRDHKAGNLSVTDAVWKRVLSLPLYPAMRDGDVEDVVQALSDSLERARSTQYVART